MKKKPINPAKILFLTGFLLLFAAAGFSQEKSKSPPNCQPEVLMSSILDSLNVKGTLQIGTLRVACVQPPEKMYSKYIFEPYKGRKFTTTLKNSSGGIINTFVWYGEKYFTNEARLTHYEIVGGRDALKEIEAGDHSLEFAINDRVFQTFRFSVLTKESPDVYRPGIIYMLEGAWRDEAVLSAGTLESGIFFSFRLRADYEIADAKPVIVPVEMNIVRDRDKTVVAENRNLKLDLKNTWHYFRLFFERPNKELTKDSSTLKLKEIMAVDGNYTINLSYNGKSYATYKFAVKDGKINGQELPARAIRVILPANILRK